MRSREVSFSELYKQHKEMVFRVALSLVSNVDDAEDVTQETFIQIQRSLKGFKEQSKLSTWVYRITVRVASKWLAKNFKARSLEYVPEGMVQRNESLSLDLLAGLNKLPFNSRVIVGLVLVQGLSHKEVAEVLNIPEGTVASRLNTAKQRLMILLG